MHSSPYLRCVQTSVAISAGLAQDPSPLRTTALDEQAPNPPSPLGPGTRPPAVAESAGSGAADLKSGEPHKTRKSILRLDAFLGEWLEPSYFELITPPPSSVLMLASAKTALLRLEAYENYSPFNMHSHSGSHGQLWGAGPRASPVSPTAGGDSDGLETMAAMSSSLPSGGRGINSQGFQQGGTSVVQPAEAGGYVAPVPNYAVSSSATIPLGYVAHARDACVNFDYQWDSMRGPLDLGDGGTFGEEWTAMHHRFRKGLQGLVDWYVQAEDPTDMVTKLARQDSGDDTECAVEDPDDEDTEAVVIMVSHGAGCNALIGAIINQPVLNNIGIASLTMAVRKPEAEVSTAGMSVRVDAGHEPGEAATKVPIHEHYDLKLFANIEHLRSAAPTPVPSRSASIVGMTAAKTRGRFSNSFSAPLSKFSFNDGTGSRSSSANAPLSGVRQPSVTSPSTPRGTWPSTLPEGGITVGSGVTSFTNSNLSFGLSRTPSIGLWSPISRREDSEAIDDEEEEDDNMLLNFSHEKITAPASGSAATATPATGAGTPAAPATKRKEKEPPGDAEARVATQPEGPGSDGLCFGDPRPPGEEEPIRDVSSAKRRWTINERPHPRAS